MANSKVLSDGQILKLINERARLRAVKSEASLLLRTKLIDLQKEIADLERPFDVKLSKIENGIKQAVLARGTAEGLNSDIDTQVIYVSGYDRRGVDLDGLWSLQENAPKVWSAVNPFVKITHIGPRVDIKD